jgi:hypothetical protein
VTVDTPAAWLVAMLLDETLAGLADADTMLTRSIETFAVA